MTVTILLTLGAGSGAAQNLYERPPFSPMPAPSFLELQQTLDSAREIAEAYTKNLPNFIASETVRRQFLEKNSKSWKPQDTLLIDVAFIEGDEEYTLRQVNGKPTIKQRKDLDGMNVSGEFGSSMWSVFNPNSEAKFKWERWVRLGERTAHVFSYQIEKGRGGYSWKLSGGYAGPLAYGGLVYIDCETLQVLRLTTIAEGVPADWPLADAIGELAYGSVVIDGHTFLLPVHAETLLKWRDGAQTRVMKEYSNYRRFSTETILRVLPTDLRP